MGGGSGGGEGVGGEDLGAFPSFSSWLVIGHEQRGNTLIYSAWLLSIKIWKPEVHVYKSRQGKKIITRITNRTKQWKIFEGLEFFPIVGGLDHQRRPAKVSVRVSNEKYGAVLLSLFSSLRHNNQFASVPSILNSWAWLPLTPYTPENTRWKDVQNRNKQIERQSKEVKRR